MTQLLLPLNKRPLDKIGLGAISPYVSLPLLTWNERLINLISCHKEIQSILGTIILMWPLIPLLTGEELRLGSFAARFNNILQ